MRRSRWSPHHIGGDHLVRILEVSAAQRGKPGHSLGQRRGVHRQGDADLGARKGIDLRLIEPGKPNQNAYVDVQRATAR